jgi:hypothetical protein
MANVIRLGTRKHWGLLFGAIALGWLILALPPGFFAGEPSADQLRVQLEEHQAALAGLRKQSTSARTTVNR